LGAHAVADRPGQPDCMVRVAKPQHRHKAHARPSGPAGAAGLHAAGGKKHSIVTRRTLDPLTWHNVYHETATPRTGNLNTEALPQGLLSFGSGPSGMQRDPRHRFCNAPEAPLLNGRGDRGTPQGLVSPPSGLPKRHTREGAAGSRNSVILNRSNQNKKDGRGRP